MDQIQEHTHTLTIPNSRFQYAPAAENGPGPERREKEETSSNSGRSGEETRVKNISVRLWQRIS